MSDEKMDRRVQRTRELLKNALMQLIDEKGYDAITVQDVVERANVGRTTFYSHYESKDDLLLDHYTEFASHLIESPLSYDDLMGDDPPVEMVRFLQTMTQGKARYSAITRGRYAEFVIRGAYLQLERNLTASLHAAFPDTKPAYSLDLLVNYVVRAQHSLIDWWLTGRTDHSVEDVARLLHHMRRSALREAYGISFTEGEK
jgi:AcrR family transcriptional regulator